MSALLLVVDPQECAGLWIRMTLSGGELEQSMATKLFETVLKIFQRHQCTGYKVAVSDREAETDQCWSGWSLGSQSQE